MRALAVVLALSAPVTASVALADAREDRLLAKARQLPDVRPELVEPSVHAALFAEEGEITAELLLTMGWLETRFEPANRTGRVCGPLGVNPTDIGEPRSSCLLWERDPAAAYAAGVREMRLLLADRRVRGDIRRALLYRACGNLAFVRGGCLAKRRYPALMLGRAARLASDT